MKFEMLIEAVSHGDILYGVEYKSPRRYTLTPQEEHIRDIAYSIKKIDSPYFKEAAQSMAKHVKSNTVLVPIPSSKGDTDVNLKLSNEIAKLTNATVDDVLSTTALRQSNLVRNKSGLKRLTAKDMKLILNHHIKDNRTIMFVDNVSTTGASIIGAMNLIHGGKGLVYARVLK